MTEEIKEDRGRDGGHSKLFTRRVIAEGAALITGGCQVMLRQLAVPDFALDKEEHFPFHSARLISNKALLLRSWLMSCPLGSRRGRSQSVPSPNLRDAGSCLSCRRSLMAHVGHACGSASWSSTLLLFWMLLLAGFSLPGIFHDCLAVGSVPGVGLGDGTRVSGRGSSVKMWALLVLATVPSPSCLARVKLTSHPAHEVTEAER